MQAVEKGDGVSFDSFAQEFQYYWNKLPDRMIFLGLLAAWMLLFQFYGWTSAIEGRNGSLFSWMWNKWDDVANDASHGKLIPFAVLALLWVRRRQLTEAVRGIWWPGLVGLALCLGLQVVGFLVQQPRVSMIAFFGGAWVLVGLVWGHAALRVAFFPFVIFAFAMPLGGTFAQGLTLPLRMCAAQGAKFVAGDVLDVPVVREGTKLIDPSGIFGSFDVAAECSGIRSFVALLAITTIFAVLTKRSWWRRVVMISSTIPLSLICNVARITTIILAANTFKTAEAGKFVDRYFGYVTYLMAIGGVLLLGRLLKEKPLAEPP